MWALKILHEKNWRVSLCVRELYHPQDFLLILAAILVCRNNTGFPSSIVVPFLFGFWVLLAWFTTGCPDRSSTLVDTVTGEMSLSVRSSRSRV